jgi:hypothetical protein
MAETGLQVQAFRLMPTSLGEAMEMAKLIAGSELCPKAYRGKQADCVVAYDYGRSLGLSWMQSLRNVSVINGQAALWGDAVPAVIYGSGECERFHEYFEGTPFEDGYKAVCIIKRKGMPDEVIRSFSVADAKVAKLWRKTGREGQDTPWITYPGRMLQMRARGFSARDSFPDKLAGLILAEEAEDYPAGVVSAADSPAGEVTVSPGLAKFDQLAEGVKDNLEKAFATLNLAPGLRFAKLNEYLLNPDRTLDENAAALLDWCRTEFANRAGRPREKKSEGGNGKSPAPVKASEAAPATGAASSPVGQPAATAGPSSGPVPASEVFGKKEPVAPAALAPDQRLGF